MKISIFPLAMMLLGLLATSSCALRPLGLKRSATPPWVFRVTATQGDNAQCTATKDNQPYISLYVTCVTLDRSGYLNIHYRVGLTIQATQTIPQVLEFGDIACMMAMSQAAVPVTLGSLGPIPPNGLYYSCSTGITGGGQVPGPVGSVTWP